MAGLQNLWDTNIHFQKNMMTKYQLTAIMVIGLSTLCFAQGGTPDFTFKLGKTNYFINLSKGYPKAQNDTIFYNLYRSGKAQRIAKEIKSVTNKETGDTVKSGYYVVLENTISFFQISNTEPASQNVYTQNAKGLLTLKTGILKMSPPKLPIEPLPPTVASSSYPQQVDIPAEFPGGINEARQHIAKHLKYPDEAIKHGVNGTVHAKFAIEVDGSISNIEIVKKLGYGCDEEVIRVLKRMPKWTPAKLDGKSVKSYFTMPISFRTQD